MSSFPLIRGSLEEEPFVWLGGTTAYDMDIALLLAIMDYWSVTSDDYATRVANLTTGNGGGNTLTGGLGLNLYYGNDTDNTDFDPTSAAVFILV